MEVVFLKPDWASIVWRPFREQSQWKLLEENAFSVFFVIYYHFTVVFFILQWSHGAYWNWQQPTQQCLSSCFSSTSSSILLLLLLILVQDQVWFINTHHHHHHHNTNNHHHHRTKDPKLRWSFSTRTYYSGSLSNILYRTAVGTFLCQIIIWHCDRKRWLWRVLHKCRTTWLTFTFPSK